MFYCAIMTDDNHDSRADRIIDVAMQLAEEDGYDAVRLRDIAARADVALGTVYRRFSGKEDILAAALQRLVDHFQGAVTFAPIPGDNVESRIGVFLALATQALAERPKLAAALLRTVASGEPDLAVRVTEYRDTMDRILVMVLRGTADASEPTERELLFARLVQNTWFAEMVGWTGGLQTVEDAIDRVREAIVIFLRGMEAS